MNVVPDASVVVKWFVPESDYEQARNLRDDYLDGRHELVAPALLPFEVINALKYTGLLDEEGLSVAAESAVEYDVELRSFERLGAVVETAVDLDLPVYDASYVALASAVDGRLYTADETLLSAVAGTALTDRVAHVAEYP